MRYFAPSLLAVIIFVIACTVLPKAGRTPAAQASTCLSTIKLPKNFTVQEIRVLLTDTRIKTVEDMLACLARDLDLKVLLVHTSMAAQNSDSANPRAITFVIDDDKQVRAAFTVNSGEAHLVQADSVEFMFNNRTRGEIEYYDIPFHKERGQLSSPNPGLCLNCHGVNGQVTAGGPKPLFDRDPWPRVVVADSNFSPENDPDDFCPNRRKAHHQLEARALEAFHNKPRYQALQGETMGDVNVLDLAVRKLNSRRVAKWVMSTPDYQKFKFLIYGAAFGCFHKPDEMISKRQIAKMTDIRKLDPKVQNAKTQIELESLETEVRIATWRENLAANERNAPLLNDLTANRPVTFELPSDGARACEPPSYVRNGDVDPSKEILPQIEIYYAKKMKQEPRAPSIFERYMADRLFADYDMKTFRFIFESRGLDISDWDTQPRPGYGRGPGMLRDALFDLEPTDGKDYQVLADIVHRRQFEACPRLLELSLQRFN